MLHFPHAVDVARSIFNFGRSCWINAIGSAEQCGNGRSSALLNVEENAIGEAYYKFASFCLQLMDGESELPDADVNPVFVESILKSMQFGSKNARFKFPKVLVLPDISEYLFIIEEVNMSYFLFVLYEHVVITNGFFLLKFRPRKFHFGIS